MREQNQECHRNEVEKGSAVALHGVRETIQVVAKKEAIDKGLPIPGVDCPIPRS